MTTGTGFGKKPASKPVSKNADKRAQASKQYDNMKADGMPEFNIYIRVKNKKQWYPVGSLAVNRTNKINQAIFQNEDELLKGAFRLFPVLKKQQANLEYGYRVKDFKDEPIQVAERPAESGGSLFQAAIAQVQDTFSAIFKRKS